MDYRLQSKDRVAEWIHKQYLYCMLTQYNKKKEEETHFRSKDTLRLKVRGWKKIFQANGNQKKAGVAILISDKTDFKTKSITRDKEGH